ncbi:MAG: hypothetical protein GY866_38745, partial [Proteobacteria bacterium]|nr:hypothetical protein [Pseudomonadota bacterium]
MNEDGTAKMIVFDTDQDGGRRMSPEFLTFVKLDARIENDSSLKTQNVKCGMFAKIFFNRPEWKI